MKTEDMDLLGGILGALMAFFFVGKLLSVSHRRPRPYEHRAPTPEQVKAHVEQVRWEAETSASQKVETLAQEVKENAQDADAAAAALRDSQL